MADTPGDLSDLEKARSATLQRIGRNVVNLQKMEGMLKKLMIVGDISAPASQLRAVIKKRIKKISQMSLGRLVEDASKALFAEIEPPSTIPENIQEPWFSFTFKVHGGVDTVHPWRKELRLVVRERNRLIHQMLDSFDPHTVQGCQAFDELLEAQRAQISVAYSAVESLLIAVREAIADIIAGEVEIGVGPGNEQ